MFIITQLIGLFVVSTYVNGLELPYGMEPPAELKEKPQGLQIIFSFVFAIVLFFLLIKLNAETFIRLWFFAVITIALALAFNALLQTVIIPYKPIIAVACALPLSYMKIFKRNLYVHNFTELLIYPGIAAVFVSLLNVLWICIILLVISLYDIWAVWHSQFMEKMAKYQINNLKFFTGFFMPYMGKKEKRKFQFLKTKYTNKPAQLESQLKKAKIRVSLAILGGGDIVFPIITAGVFYKTYASIFPSLIIIASATFALLFLFVTAQKGKFYPAMPFITIGMYLGMIVSWIIF
ncbi:MAG: presenilin family intramembrane aspartyl protease [Nanoarchaeota archaeon]